MNDALQTKAPAGGSRAGAGNKAFLSVASVRQSAGVPQVLAVMVVAMSAAAVQAVLAAPLEPAACKLVAIVLAWHANEQTGHAWPSLQTIANEASLSRERVKTMVAALKARGILVVVKASEGGSNKATTVYRFDLDSLRAPGSAATPVRGQPGSPAYGTRFAGNPSPGSPATPKRDERKAKPSLSSKPRASVAAGRPSGAAAPARGQKRTAVPQSGFDAPGRYDEAEVDHGA